MASVILSQSHVHTLESFKDNLDFLLSVFTCVTAFTKYQPVLEPNLIVGGSVRFVLYEIILFYLLSCEAEDVTGKSIVCPLLDVCD